jgi:acetyl esterase
VARLPRLSPAAEHRLLKFLCGLPRSVQRRVFGPPPSLEGQTLAADVHVLLQIAKVARGDGVAEGVEVAAARLQRRREAETVGHRPPLPMAAVEDFEIPGPAGAMAARRYVPPGAAAGSASLLVYYHGGGWVIGDLDTHDSPCRFLAAHSGAQVLAIDYRLAPEHPFPAAAEDAFAAYAWARANAAALGCDPGRVGVGGDSAGANLAAATCLLARDEELPAPAMQMLIYPIAETTEELPSRLTFGGGFLLTKPDMDFFENHYLPAGVDRADPRVSVLHADLANLPPAYVATAGFDPLRDEGEAYALRMREAGVPVTMRRHAGLVHTYANLTAICPSARAAMLEAAAALRTGLA